jgi:hypothetical protein
MFSVFCYVDSHSDEPRWAIKELQKLTIDGVDYFREEGNSIQLQTLERLTVAGVVKVFETREEAVAYAAGWFEARAASFSAAAATVRGGAA